MAKEGVRLSPTSKPATGQSESAARAAILRSIRDHLAESASRDAVTDEGKSSAAAVGHGQRDSAIAVDAVRANGHQQGVRRSPIEIFREQLEAIGGHCVVVPNEVEAARALKRIIAELQTTPLLAQRIALSDAPVVERMLREIEASVDEATISPGAAELFDYDVGLTAAQAAIAETGTLVLESESERHRLVSLLPPVHLAIINAADIRLTLGEALNHVRRDGSETMSRTITFITGPSRTADIELTLTIGVHGPKELYVIVCT